MNKTDQRYEDILNTCKYCKSFTDNGTKRNRYWCEKYHCHLCDAYKCGKLSSTYKVWLGKI